MLFNSSSLPKTILFFRLRCFKWILHASQHEVCKQFAEQTYIRNRPEIRHGLCCTCFRQHREKRNLLGRWDIATGENLGHFVQQNVQKIIWRMFQQFCNKVQIIASPADLQARYRMLQLCHSPKGSVNVVLIMGGAGSPWNKRAQLLPDPTDPSRQPPHPP